jgi:hypothetical protein
LKRAGTGTCKREPWLDSHTLKNSAWKRLWTCRKATGGDGEQSQNAQTQCGREGCTKSMNAVYVIVCTSGIPTALLNPCLASIRKSFIMHRFSLRSVRLYDQFLIHHGLRFLLVWLPLPVINTYLQKQIKHKPPSTTSILSIDFFQENKHSLNSIYPGYCIRRYETILDFLKQIYWQTWLFPLKICKSLPCTYVYIYAWFSSTGQKLFQFGELVVGLYIFLCTWQNWVTLAWITGRRCQLCKCALLLEKQPKLQWDISQLLTNLSLKLPELLLRVRKSQ